MPETPETGGRSALNYTARDYDGLLQVMRERARELLPEWADPTSEADAGNVLLEAFAAMGDILSYYQDRIAGESFLGTAQGRGSIIQHLRLIGYTLATAAPAAAELTLLFPVSYAGMVTVSPGDAFATSSRRDRPSVRFEYTGGAELTIDCAALPETTDPKSGRHYRYYGPDPFALTGARDAGARPGLPVEEGRLIRRERLGRSTGAPNQRFPLAHPRLILRPLGQGPALGGDMVLTIEDGDAVERWSLRETLAFSRPLPSDAAPAPEAQRDAVVETDEHDRASVCFGDGTFGARPPEGAHIFATYRVGGGAHGNVAAGAITTIASAPQLSLVGTQVVNTAAASGGADRESIEHAKLQAPAVFRARRRAVTRDDYEALARSFQGVGKVRAVTTSWNIVTLHVAPKGGGPPSDTLKAGLLAFFEDKRPITTRIEIEGVDYVDVYVTAEVGVERYYDADTVRAQAAAVAGRLLAFEAVDFGKTLYLSKFYEAIEAIPGVNYVTVTQFSRSPSRPGPDPMLTGRIDLDPGELARTPGGAKAAGIRVVPPSL